MNSPHASVRVDAVVRRSRAASLASLLALIVLGVAWEIWLAPTGRGTLAIKVLPLLSCVSGVWARRLFTFRWLALLVWLYFGEGVVRAATERGLSQQLAGLEIVLSLALFVAAAVFIRRVQRLAPHPAP
jgi:uncharacterized membrane protein